MEYRRLGSSGIKVSVLSLGSWITYGGQVGVDSAAECIKTAYDAGVNFFDNAENYSGGEAERIMGAALRKLGLRRSSYLVSTKTYWGLHEGVNEKDTLNRKRLFDAIDGSLGRFGLDYVDFIYCHRPDRETPIEETVWAMSDIIASGRALYWGTSEWSAEEIREAWDIADRRNLRKPQMEEPLYNLFSRRRVEEEYARLYDGIGLGLTTFSPLASGLLSGKYEKGIPDGSRLSLPDYASIKDKVMKPGRLEATAKVGAIARELGATTAQLAIAWCASNPRVSSVIAGASSPAHVGENMKAADLAARLDAGTLARIAEATEGLSDRTGAK